MRRWTANLLLIAGLAMAGICAWYMLRGSIAQDWENWAFERNLQGEPVGVADYLRHKSEDAVANIRSMLSRHEPLERASEPAPVAPRQTETPARSSPPPLVWNGERLGRLVIPRLRLSAVVREGVGEDTLGIALGHIPGTALPGSSGNIGVAGHRDTLFRSLRNIRKDDIIEFQTLNATFQYQVTSTRIVTPKDVEVLAASLQPEITLVTCYPFYYVGSAPDRFIVKARQLSSDAPPREPAILKASVAAAPPPTRSEISRAIPQRPGTRTIPFDVPTGHSRQLTRGISFGLSSTDPSGRRVDGWMWLMPDRKTIWLRSHSAWSPVIFFGGPDGRERKLVITSVTARSVKGYLVLPAV